MPTYEYRCSDCGKAFEQMEHMDEHTSAHPVCPKCKSENVEQQLSVFTAQTSRKS